MMSMLKEDSLDMANGTYPETAGPPNLLARFNLSLGNYVMIDLPLQFMWIVLFSIFTYGINPSCSNFHSYGGLVIGLSVCVIFLEGIYYIMKKRVDDRMVKDEEVNVGVWTQSLMIFFIIIVIINGILWISGIINLDSYHSETDHGCNGIFCLTIFYIIGLSIQIIGAFLFVYTYLNKK